ncbi:MAG: ABC transporter ATP-binding protein/permease [Candidatus Nomurabacteria bacterium]|jgi:ATP-binding cassette subfamily B protein|nr:ABC transporter ATP-binding protein/permease [Candidatus Nomurabacteria bacterium]
MAKPKTENKSEMRGGPNGGPMGRGAVEKPKNFKKSIGQLWKHLARYKTGFIVAIVLAVASTAFAIIGPKLLGNMTNDIVSDFVAMQVYDKIPEPIRDHIPSGTVGFDGLQNYLQNELPKLAAANPEIAQQLTELKSASENAEQDISVPDSVKDSIADIDFSSKPIMRYDRLAGTAVLLIVLYVISAILAYVMGIILNRITQKSAQELRTEISLKINHLPLSYFDKQSYGNVLSRITNDVDTIAQSLNQGLNQIVTSITMIFGILGMMISISLELTGVALVTVPVFLIIVMSLMKASQKHFKGQQDTLGELNGHIEESYAGHNVIRAFGREKTVLNEFNKHNGKLYRHAWKAQFLSGLAFPAMNFISNLGFIGVALLGGSMAISGRVTIGGIQAFIQYLNNFNQPLMQLSQIANVLQSTAAASERVFEFLDEKEELDTGCSSEFTPVEIKGAVEFDRVNFSYEKGQPVIKNFSAKVTSGQKIAIVGPTGAGKTTIVNLLMRFYDPDSGTIKIDSIDDLKVPRGDVRKMFGMVLQDTWLFNGTIKDNLRYGKPDATDAEVYNIAKAAHVDHFIKSLSDGYDTILDEDSDNVSAGEKQLLTIARAMIADPPMLILDEATSNVDTRTEVLIQKAMEKLMHGRTSFIIAHRLSTIKGADLIFVMRDGNIVEQGNHAELMAQDGFYAKLYNSQFSGK